MKKIFLLLLTIAFMHNAFYSCASESLVKTSTNKMFILAEKLIEDGSINMAYLLLDKYLKTPNLSNENKYLVYKDMAKIHLYEQDLVNYEKFNRKAYEIKKKEGEIYKGMYYAEKAYMWHFLMWGDSAAFYSNRSMEIIQKNRKDFKKISVAYVYQVYAICFLYRKLDPKLRLKDPHDQPIERILMNQWFDSAKVYVKKYPYQFSSDNAMLHRAIANRFVDLVSGYHYNEKDCQKKMNKLQWFCYNEAMKEYKLANYYTNLNCWNDVFLTNSMVGINYMSIGEKIKAKNHFNLLLSNYFLKFKKIEQSPNARLLMNIYSYKIINDELLPYNEKEIDADIEQLKKIRSNWWATVNQSEKYNYDSYYISPNIYIYKLYVKKYLYTKNASNLKLAASYLLAHIVSFHLSNMEKEINSFKKHNAFLEFSQLKSNSLKKSIESYLSLREIKIPDAPLVSIALIQSQLKKNECVVIPDLEGGGQNSSKYKIIVKQKSIQLFELKTDIHYVKNNFDAISFSNFKADAYQQYKEKIKPVLSADPLINKVYLMYFDYSNYSAMISDTSGSNYDQLKYLGKTIQFVNLYNPYHFFTAKRLPQSSNVDFVQLQTNEFSGLPFMESFSKKSLGPLKFSTSIFNGDFAKTLSAQGVLHLFGHGTISNNKESGNENIELPYTSNFSSSSIAKIDEMQNVNRSLIVLNNCFSGFNNNSNTGEIDRGLYLNLMHNGALNVIVSPGKTDDECSAKIFNFFYKYLGEGQTPSDALFHAKISYLNTNKGSLTHPKFWSQYRLLTNYPFPIFYPELQKKNTYLPFTLFFIGILIAILFHLRVQMKNF